MRKLLRFGILPLIVWIGCGLLTGGCWDNHDINLRAMPVIMGIAKGQTHPYEVTLQIPIPGEQDLSLKIVSQEADTISEAVDDIKINIENYVDLLNVEMLVFDQTIAREGLQEELSYAIRSRDLSPKALVAVTDADMKKLLTNTKNAIQHDGTTFFKFSDKKAGWTPKTAKTHLWEAFASTKSYTEDVMLPIIRPGRETVLSFAGSALLRQGKMIARLGQEETFFVNVVTNRYDSAAVEVLQDANVTLQSVRMRWKARLTGDGPAMDGKLVVHASLTEMKKTLSKSELVAELISFIREHLDLLTKKLLQSGSDPLGLGNHFRSKLPLEKLERWRSDYYPGMKITCRVRVVIDSLGNLELDN